MANQTNIPWADIESRLHTLQPTEGGFTPAKRGIVTLDDDQRIFVKIATGEATKTWIDHEREVYHWLSRHDYAYAPALVSETEGGLALPDLSVYDWAEGWSEHKLGALFEAMESLAALKPGQLMFTDADYGGNFWGAVPKSMAAYMWAQPFVEPGRLDVVRQIISNPELRKEYYQLSETEPWKGHELCHGDTRSDNFAFDPETGHGWLVDWNWTTLSRKKFDEAMVWTNVHKSGYDVRAHAAGFDRASLAYMVGFWLGSAMQVPDDDRSVRLRTHQLESAIAAHELIQMQ